VCNEVPVNTVTSANRSAYKYTLYRAWKKVQLVIFYLLYHLR